MDHITNYFTNNFKNSELAEFSQVVVHVILFIIPLLITLSMLRSLGILAVCDPKSFPHCWIHFGETATFLHLKSAIFFVVMGTLHLVGCELSNMENQSVI